MTKNDDILLNITEFKVIELKIKMKHFCSISYSEEDNKLYILVPVDERYCIIYRYIPV